MNCFRSAATVVFALAALPLAGCADDTSGENSDVASHVSIVRERVRATNERDWATWQSLHTDDATRTAPELEEPLEGSAAMRKALESIGEAFPDYHLEVIQAFGDRDRLSVQFHTTGTNTGPLALGDVVLPATNRKIEQDWVGVFRFEDDLIAEIDEFYDQYLLMVELGLAPAF